MTTIWQYLVRSAAGTTSRDTPYDEERMGRKHLSLPNQPVKYSRFPRLKKVTVYLLLADLIIFGSLLRLFDPLITLLLRNEELFGPRVTLSRPDTSDVLKPSSQNRIPRILHQTTANETIPEKWVVSQQSCKVAYSDFVYMLWTDESSREFLSSNYPWFVETWDNYPFPIQRADAIRYFVLHQYGGIYLDMDTLCNETFPLHQVESDTATHHAVFKSTKPTGVTNDFMISSARHPAFAAAIAKLPHFYGITRLWARMLPYGAIMISSGPFFLSLVLKNYLLEQPSTRSPTMQVVNQTVLAPYITDLESCTWHRDDAKAIMWLGDRPWTWYGLGAIAFVGGLYILNNLLLAVYKAFIRKASSVTYNLKLAKLT
ncbi:Fc.00g044190.m01.CDS01 [Cosmosporella sp. VM-42]